MPIESLYCVSDDDDKPMIRLEAESTTQRVIVWKCPACGRYAREYPNRSEEHTSELQSQR